MEAIRRLGCVVCRVYFLDGKSKAVDICKLYSIFHDIITNIKNYKLRQVSVTKKKFINYLIAPLDTAGEIVQRISESLGLNPTDGWALYQVCFIS